MTIHPTGVCLFGLLLIGSLASSQREHPSETPGKLEIAKHPLVLESPSGPQTKNIDVVKLREEAEELAKLSQSLTTDVNQVEQGKLPKDMADKLKHIEKLAKHLRGELMP
jgi:hypothetical protein